MPVSIILPPALASVIGLEAGRRGQSVASFILDRLSDAYGLRPLPSSASAVPLITDDTTDDHDR